MGKAPAVALLRGLLVVAPLLSEPALAEDPADPTIVVTARRLEERSLEVPVSVSAIAAKDIGAGSVNDLQSLASRVPGLFFETIWGGGNSFPILRGQNQPSVFGDNVGVFVDGVYQANREAIDVETLDLERIEVVKGPQSALFGRSTFAGLIHYVPAKPAETWQASGSTDAGTDGYFGLRGALSMRSTHCSRRAWQRIGARPKEPGSTPPIRRSTLEIVAVSRLP